MLIKVLGWLSTVILAACYIPQLHLTYTTKTVEGLSVVQWIILAVGFVFSLTYAWSVKAWPIFAGQLWGLICSLIIIGMYFKYKEK